MYPDTRSSVAAKLIGVFVPIFSHFLSQLVICSPTVKRIAQPCPLQKHETTRSLLETRKWSVGNAALLHRKLRIWKCSKSSLQILSPKKVSIATAAVAETRKCSVTELDEKDKSYYRGSCCWLTGPLQLAMRETRATPPFVT